MSFSPSLSNYLGAQTYYNEAHSVGPELIQDDLSAEIEGLELAEAVDPLETNFSNVNSPYLRNPDDEEDPVFIQDCSSTPNRKKAKFDTMKVTLKLASEDIIVPTTRQEYNRITNAFENFCATELWTEAVGDVEKAAISRTLSGETPEWIVLFIMDKIDDIDIHSGKTKDLSIPRGTYGSAQKLRAGLAHSFGREWGLGSQPWMENPLAQRSFIGNPVLSPIISQYMVSLRRRKAQAGETVTSARAVDSQLLQKLYDNNLNFPHDAAIVTSSSRKRKGDLPEKWAGHQVRLMLQTLYTIAFLCLLRFDEALGILWEDIIFEPWEGKLRLRLNLAVRKTHQTGDIQPFYLYPQPQQPSVCAVSLVCQWWNLSQKMGHEMHGYVFRKKIGHDRVSVRAEDNMSSASFLTCFRNNLCDVNVDPRLYGTHSFRRGGCQYLAMELRWPIRHICTWGGWAEDFDNWGTIFKYLLSYVDTPMLERSDYMNPKREKHDPCVSCGRTCFCS